MASDREFVAHCRRCGDLGTWDRPGMAETEATIHRTRALTGGCTGLVQVYRVMTREEWTATPENRKHRIAGVNPLILMRDDGGATVLYPVRLKEDA